MWGLYLRATCEINPLIINPSASIPEARGDCLCANAPIWCFFGIQEWIKSAASTLRPSDTRML